MTWRNCDFREPFFVCHDFDLKIFDIGIFFADGHLQKLLLTTCRDVVVVVVEVVAADGGAPPVFFSKTKTIDLIQYDCLKDTVFRVS